MTKRQRAGKHDVRDHFLDYSIEIYGRQLVNETKCLLNILMLFLPLPFFWTLYDQQGTYWIAQAENMNRDLGFYKLAKDQMQTLNSLLILVFIPLFDYGIYPLLQRIGIHRPLQKICIGGILCAFALLLAAIVQRQIEMHALNTVSIWWQVPQIVVITAAEIFFAITCLSFAFEQAPKSMKSVVQACYLLTMAIGDLILIVFSAIPMFQFLSSKFILFEGLMLFDMMIFVMLAYRYKPIEL